MARLSTWFGVAVLALATLVSLHAQHTFHASAVEGRGSIADGLANISFKIEIRNVSSSSMTNVVVVFADNTEVSVGDVAGEATVTTDQQTRTVDVGESPTRSITVPVTLKYQVDGENIEAPWTLSVFVE